MIISENGQRITQWRKLIGNPSRLVSMVCNEYSLKDKNEAKTEHENRNSNTLTYEAKNGAYHFQLDENRFKLDANLLREALEITPIDQAHQFESPPSGDAIMDFVKSVGLPMGKFRCFQEMLWGIITCTNVDYAELMWEECVQAIQTFLTDKANLGTPTKKDKKTKPHVIPYCRFTKLIIYCLGRKHNLHQRSEYPFHLAEEDHRHGNLKFVSKGEEDEVFGMQIPKELIMDDIRNAPYYNAYLEMIAKHDQKIAAEKGRKKKFASKASAKQPKPVSSKQSKPAPTKKPKVAQEKTSKPSPTKQSRKGKVAKEHGQALVGGVTIREPVSKTVQKLPVIEGKGKGITTDEQAALSLLDLHKPKKKSTMDQFIFQRRIPATKDTSTGPSAQPQDDISANIVQDTPSSPDAETGADTDVTTSTATTEVLHVEDVQGEDVSYMMVLEEKTAELDEG
ncbi:hypothetical protein Tco_0984252 [Tanacetum coccineum]